MTNEPWKDYATSEDDGPWSEYGKPTEPTQAEPAGPKIAKPKRTWGEAAEDTGRAVMSGLAGLVKTGGDLYGLASGDMDNAATRLGSEGQEYWREGQSDTLKQSRERRAEKIAGADGALGQAWEAVKETVTDPALLTDLVAENVTSLIPVAGAGQVGAKIGAKVAARGLAGEAAETAAKAAATRAGTAAAVGTGAGMQGASVGSQTYDELVKADDATWAESPEYQARIAAGEDPTSIKHELALEASRLSAGGAAAISVGSQFLPGGATIERAVSGAAGKVGAGRLAELLGPSLAGRVAGAARGFAGEGVQEAIEEGGGQLGSNLSKQTIDPNQSITDGVGESAGLGFLGGGMLGGPIGAMPTPEAESAPTAEGEQQLLGLPAPDGSPGYGVVQVGPDGVATTTQQRQTQQDDSVAFAQERADAGLTPDVNAARAAHPSAVPNVLATGEPIPDPNAGVLSRAVVRGIESGVVPTLRPEEAAANMVMQAAVQDAMARREDAPTATPATEPRPPLNMDPATGELVEQTEQSVVDYLSANFTAGNMPAVSAVAKAYGFKPDAANRVRREALALVGARKQEGRLVESMGQVSSATIGEEETLTGTLAPATPPTGAADSAATVASAPDVQSERPTYDTTPDLLDTDITPPSGGAFENRGAAELMAKRTGEGAKSIKVDAGWVVRKPVDLANMPPPDALQMQPAPQSTTDRPGAVSDALPAQESEPSPAPAKPELPGDAASTSEGFGGESLSASESASLDITPVTAAASAAATSPTNELPTPSEGQREAGNFKVGRMKVNGLDVSIEYPAGVKRKESHSQPLAHAYGYVRRTEGADGEKVDVFLGERGDDASLPVFVVDQNKADGTFDEHKAMLGFSSEAEAKAAYLANYPAGWETQGFAGIKQMSHDEFKSWVRNPAETKKPAANAPEGATTGADEIRPAGKKKQRGYSNKASVTAEIAKRGLNPDDYSIVPTEQKGFIGVRKEGALQAAAPAIRERNAQEEAAPAQQSSQPTAGNEADGQPTTPRNDTLPVRGAGRPSGSPFAPPDDLPAPPRDDPQFDEKNKLRQLRNGLRRPASASGAAWTDESVKAVERQIKDLERKIATSEGKAPKSRVQEAKDKVMRLRREIGAVQNGIAESAMSPQQRERLFRLRGQLQNAETQLRAARSSAFDDQDLPANAPPVADQGQQDELGPEVRTPQEPEAAEASPADAIFANNTIFTADKVEAARARLRAKLGALNSGVDPETLIDGMTIAGGYIEGGIRSFRDYAAAMVADLGEGVKPYLLSFYEAVRNYPGVDKEGLTSVADAATEFDALLAPADLETEAVGNVKPAPKRKAKTKEAGGDRTLRADWPVDNIDGWTAMPGVAPQDSDNGITNGVKAEFLKDTRSYLKAVADALEAKGFTATTTTNAKGKTKANPAVSVDAAGPAVSGDVMLHMVAPDGVTGIYATIGAGALRGVVPSNDVGVSIMYRTTEGGSHNSGGNQWARVDLSAADFAETLADHVTRFPWKPAERRGALPVRAMINPVGADGPADAAREAGEAPLKDSLTKDEWNGLTSPFGKRQALQLAGLRESRASVAFEYLTADERARLGVAARTVLAGNDTTTSPELAHTRAEESPKEGNNGPAARSDRNRQADVAGDPEVGPSAGAGDAPPANVGGQQSQQAEGAGGRPSPGGQADEGTERRTGSGRGNPGQQLASDAQGVSGSSGSPPDAVIPKTNFSITDELDFTGQGEVSKYNGNVAAIRLLKQLEAEGRRATAEEQSVLARYVGWGGIPKAFRHPSTGKVAKGWEGRVSELESLLTEEELAAAGRSTQDAHYTAANVVTAMWQAVERMGFDRGRILEPSMGTGNFFGLMPKGIRSGSALTGVELDSITGRIAKQLYQKANVQVRGFNDLKIAPGTFDLAIGNPPFGSQSIYDPSMPHLSKLSIHNFFFAKSIESLRPGGVLAMVVSSSFMDANTSTARAMISGKANLLGAIRLPQTAFQQNAGTNVTTDIVFLQRVADGETTNAADWVRVGSMIDKGNSFPINRYFLANPDMMLGNMVWSTHTTIGRAGAVLEAREGENLSDALAAAVQKLPTGVYRPSVEAIEHQQELQRDADEAARTVGIYSYFVDDKGALRQRMPDIDGEASDIEVETKDAGTQRRIVGMVKIRNLLRELFNAEKNPATTDKQLESARAELNRQYEAFVKTNGLLSRDVNKRAFRNDPDLPLLLGLERDYDKGVSRDAAKKEGVSPRGESAQKADIFTKRVNFPDSAEASNVSDAKSAMLASLNAKGRIDLDYMAGIYDKSRDDMVAELGDLVFKDPEGQIEPRDAYLYGNVKAKLAAAEAAAKDDPTFNRNVDALREVIPADIDPADIFVQIGTPWIPVSDYNQFANEVLEGGVAGAYLPALGKWVVKAKSNNRTLNNDKWGTSRMGAADILETLMQNGEVVVKDKGDRDSPPVVNKTETAAALGKATELQQKFVDWVWSDPDRRERLARHYNDNFNTNVRRKYDGSHMTFPGMNKSVLDGGQLRPHQSAFAYRMVQDGVALADHVVGAGKTYASIAGVMEMRRLGLWRKPMIAVPNHLVDQWATDFMKLYPGARILAASRKDFEKSKRREMFARIATGDWDAVIVAHSSFGFIPVSADAESQILTEEVRELELAMDAVRASAGKNDMSFKQLQKRREALESKIKELADRKRDDLLDFEQMGVDALVVDEAHEFKNLYFTTAIRNASGLGNPAGSKKAFDLYVKTRVLEGKNGGANRVFLTGTPVSNSLSEVFHMQRYLQRGDLMARNVHTFDAWANTFGQIVGDWEMDAAGRFREKKRFRKFANLPELTTLWRGVADTVTRADLIRDAEAQGKKFPLPKLKGGKPNNVVAPRSQLQAKYIGEPTPRLDENGQPVIDLETGAPLQTYNEGSIIFRMENMPKDPREDNFLKATGDARKAGLDYRLIDPDAPDFADSKVNKAVASILQTWKKNDARKGTQLVFCDLSVPASARGKATASAQGKTPTWFVRDGASIAHVDGVKASLASAPEHAFFTVKSRSGYTVHEATSGMRAGSGKTKQDAIDEANRSITRSPETFARNVERNAIEQEAIDAYIERWEALRTENEAATEDGEEGDAAAVVSMDELLADSSKHSVYDDMKAKLIAGGMPASQIAFIHDYNSDAQKAALYAKVNSGEVRVLFGSTAKMGAGMNVQRKLVALHHMDAPWRPSDIEQREGRIIRQGNEFYKADPDGFEIEINRYATENTYDARQWEIIETKAKGIELFKAGDGSVREIDDLSSEAANSAEMKGAASGNPLILENIKTMKAVKDLEAQERGFTRARHSMETLVRDVERGTTFAHRRLNEAKSVADSYRPDAPFELKIAGKTLTDRKDVSVGPIASAIKEAADTKDVINAGSFRGYEMRIDGRMAGQVTALLYHQGNPFGSTTLRLADNLSATGFVQRLENIVSGIPREVEQAQAGVDAKLREAEQAKEELKQGFPRADELVQLRERSAKLVNALRQGKNTLDDDAVGALFSRTSNGVPGGRYSPNQVEADVADITARWVDSPPIKVVPKAADLPQDVVGELQRIGSDGSDIRGVYHPNGTIYVVRDNIISRRDLEETLFHEAVGHHGLRLMFGKDTERQLQRLVQAAGGWGGIKAYARRHGIDLSAYDFLAADPRLRDGRAETVLMDELFAHMAERMNDLEPSLRNRIAEFLGAVRAWLRQNGFELLAGSLSDGEMAHLLRRSERAVQGRGEGLAASVHNALFSMRETGRGERFIERNGHRFVERDGAFYLTNDRGRPADFRRAEAERRAREVDGVAVKDDGLPTWSVRLPETTVRAEARASGMRFSRRAATADALGAALNNARDVRLPAGYLLGDLLGGSNANNLGWWHKSVGTMFNLAERSPEFKRVFDSVQRMIGDVSEYANGAMDKAPDILPKFDSFKDWKKRPLSGESAKRVAKAVFDGTTLWTRDDNGRPMRTDDIDRAGIVWTGEELRQRFAMTPAEVGYYQQARAAIDKSLHDTAISQMVKLAGDDVFDTRDEALAAPNARAAAMRLRDRLMEEAKEQPRRAGSLNETARQIMDMADKVDSLTERGYAPLSRFGRFTVYVTGAGMDPVFQMFDTEREANRAARKLRGEFPGAKVEQGTLSEQQYRQFRGMTTDTLELFGEILGLDSTGDTAADQAFQAFLKAAKANRSAMKRLIHRQGTAGYSDDVGRVLASFLYSNARMTASNLNANETQRAIAAIPKEQGQLKDAAIELSSYIDDPQDEGYKLGSFNFVQYLGGSIASAMVNMTQPLTMTFPWLSQYGGAWKAANALKDAATKAGKAGSTGDDALDHFLKRADAEGITQPQEVHQLQAYASGRGILRTGDGTQASEAAAKAYNTKARVMLLWGMPFALAEQFNRRMTFIAAFNMARDQGMQDPYGFAVHAVQTTQGIYNKANKPAWARTTLGGMAFTFKQYSINYVEMLERMWRQGGKEGKQGVLLALGVMYLLAGAGGLPGMDDLDDIIDGALQRMGYNFNSKQAREQFFAGIVGESGAKFLEHGVSSLPGMPIDVAGRLGMGNLVPATGIFRKKDNYGRDVAELAGPTGDFIARSLQAADMLVTGDLAGALLSVAPKAASNVVKGADMALSGEYRDTKGRKVIETSAIEAATKAIGFQPANVAKVQNASWQAQQMVAFNRQRESEIAGKWAQAIVDAKQSKIDEARAELADWNAKNPDNPIRINPAQIRSRVKQLRMTKTERLAKAAPREVRAAVRQQLAD